MKSRYKLLFALLAGLMAGAAATSAILGQQVKAAPVYIISEADVITDVAAVKSYGAKVQGTLTPYDGHYHFVVAGGKAERLDGDAPPVGIAVIAFDSSEQAHAWYNSPAYATIKAVRQASVKGRMFLVEGVER